MINKIQFLRAEALKAWIEYRKQRGWKPKDDDSLFVSRIKSGRGEPISVARLGKIIKYAAGKAGLNPRAPDAFSLLRRSFFKVLDEGCNSGILEHHTKEAIMGRKLQGSRQNFFDVHDGRGL